MKIKVICIEDRYIDRYFILNDKEPFEQHQIFKILDVKNNNPICKVLRPRGIKKLKDMDNDTIKRYAITLGFDENEVFYWAEVGLDKELIVSLDTDAEAVKTTEDETYNYLYNGKVDEALVLGEIRGTENVYNELVNNTYKNILMMCKDNVACEQECLPLVFNYKKLQENPNIGVFGNSGSGKTYFLKSLIEELLIKNIPSIVFDPHNEFDFSSTFPGVDGKFIKDYSKNVVTINAGKDFGLRFPDLSNEDFKRFIESTNSLTDPQSMAIDEIREQTDTFEIFRDRVERLAIAKQKDEKRMNQDDFSPNEKDLLIKYGSKISTSTVLFALNSKLSNYSRKNYFSKDYDIIINALKDRKLVVVRGDYNIVSPMMSIILNDLWRKRKDYKDGEITDEYPPVITILDEAHIYAPKDMNIKAPLRNTLIDISREGRKYGMFLICATQRISELNNTVLSQMSTRFILKTVQESDKQTIARESGLSELELSRLGMLDSGCGYVISPILKTKTPIAFKARCNYTKPKITVNSFDELKVLKTADTKSNFEDFVLKSIPFRALDFHSILKQYNEESGQTKTLKELNDILTNLVKNNIIKKNGAEYISSEDNFE